MKVLITVPNFHLDGGVSSYFKAIGRHFTVQTEYFHVGAISSEERAVEKLRHLFSDAVRFRRHLRSRNNEYNLVHFNPSFNFPSLIRDALLLRIAHSNKRKTMVFFRGFNLDNAKKVERYFLKAFSINYRKANAFVVLGKIFENKLREWGFDQKIFLETTLVDDELVKDFSINDRTEKIKHNKEIHLLFLARILKEKGVIETIQAFKALSERYSNIYLTIAGDGPFMKEARRLTQDLLLKEKVAFPGYVYGNKKKDIFISSDIYIFPSYSEGMPNSVLEAMAFGLPVLTTSVGGVSDIFKDETYGFIIPPKDHESIVSGVAKIVEDKILRINMSKACHYSASQFLASNVARRLEMIYKDIVDSK